MRIGQKAFSLVELSIVLVILGLLVGGILAGQSLIRASELRAVSTEYQRWITATFAFRDKYFALPGDFNKATSFWSDNNTLCPDSNPNGSPGTCNGDADGLLEAGAGASVQGEIFGYWQHLALAGLIEGTYSGIAGSVNSLDAAISGANVNSPSSKLGGGATWQIRDLGVRTSTAGIFNGNYGNTFLFGGVGTTGMPTTAVLKGEEAWNIDTKIDDGKAATGKMVAYVSHYCATAANGSALANDVSSTGTLDAIYNLSSSSKLCLPFFRQAF